MYLFGIPGSTLYLMTSMRFPSAYFDESLRDIADESFSAGNPSSQHPAATPTAWSDLVLETFKVVEIPNSTEIRSCEICLDELPIAEFPNRRISTGCNHDPSSCLPCLRASIKSHHENKIWDAISCPECTSRLNYRDIRDFADSETFAQ
jgi:hypothetical protein